MRNSVLMKKQAEEADRLIAELAAPEDAPLETEVPVEDEAPTGAEPTEAVDDQGIQPVVDEIPPVPAVTEGELAELRGELAKSEQRYKTLQGMIDAKNQDIDDMRLLLRTLNAKQTQPAAEPEKLVTDKDEETFGKDLIDLMTRVVRKEVAPLMQNVEGQMQNVTQVATTTAMNTFEDRLSELVPDWQAVNVSPEFVTWLGKYNLKALNEAYQAYDLQGTAKFFADFKQLHLPPVVQPPVVTEPTVDKLEAKAAPSKGKVTQINPDGPKGEMWTSAKIKKLYDDLSGRKISQAEFDKQEADLFRAQREGRIAA